MAPLDDENTKRERRERLLGYVVVIPLIALVLAYELFGWVPPIPRQLARGAGFMLQIGFAIVVSAIISGWSYLFLAWLHPKWLRIAIAIAAGLYIGFDATLHTGTSPDLNGQPCQPGGPAIYNDC